MARMMVYSGNVARRDQVRLVKACGWGRMVSVVHWRTPDPDLPWALDCGGFSDYLAGRPFNEERFVKQYMRTADHVPDFCVVPDLVGQGFESLKFSLGHVDTMWWHTANYLAVQDGMHVVDVEPVLQYFDGLFVGGTVRTNRLGNRKDFSPEMGRSRGWKWDTAHAWIDLAHRFGKPCHIGRVGTYHDIQHALELGADSIDSTSWATNDTHDHLTDAFVDHLVADYQGTQRRPRRQPCAATRPRCNHVEQHDELGLCICRQDLHEGEHVLEPFFLNLTPPILASDRGPHHLAGFA